MSNIQKNSETHDKTAIAQAHWEKLKKDEGKAWEAAWPAAYKPAFVGFAAGVRALLVKDPRLLQCPDLGVRLVECAGLGLLPHWGPRGEAIVMYANSQKYGPQASLIVGYKGYEAAWYRDGIVVPGKLKVAELMPEDKWEYEETEEGTKFRWAPSHAVERTYDRMLLVFARAVLREGGCAVGIRLKAKCDEVKKWAQSRGQGGPAYNSWPLEMAMKGAIMELKRVLPFAENTERLLEYESQHGDSEERDMGDAVRVENVRPLQVQALHEPAPRETIETAALETELVPANKPATKPPARTRIVDESTTPDKPAEVAAFPEWALVKIGEWEATDEKMPKGTYDELVQEIQKLPRGSKERARIGQRLEKLGHASEATAQRQPGEEG